jgi:hypothetical protein
MKKELDVLATLYVKLKIKPKKDLNSSVSSAQSERHAVTREPVYKAVIYLLAHFPEKCRDDNGKVSSTKIESLLVQKSPLWFKDEDEEGDEIPLSSRKIKELISEAIKL